MKYVDIDKDWKVSPLELADIIKQAEIDRRAKDSKWSYSEDIWINGIVLNLIFK